MLDAFDDTLIRTRDADRLRSTALDQVAGVEPGDVRPVK